MIYMQQKHVIMTTVGRTLCSSKLSKFIAMLPQALIRHLISLWKTSLVTNQRFGLSVMSMKAIYCMVVKDAAKLSLQICRNTLLTTRLFRDTDPSVFKVLDDNNDDGMIQNISKAIFKRSVNILCIIKMSIPFG